MYYFISTLPDVSLCIKGSILSHEINKKGKFGLIKTTKQRKLRISTE